MRWSRVRIPPGSPFNPQKNRSTYTASTTWTRFVGGRLWVPIKHGIGVCGPFRQARLPRARQIARAHKVIYQARLLDRVSAKSDSKRQYDCHPEHQGNSQPISGRFPSSVDSCQAPSFLCQLDGWRVIVHTFIPNRGAFHFYDSNS